MYTFGRVAILLVAVGLMIDFYLLNHLYFENWASQNSPDARTEESTVLRVALVSNLELDGDDWHADSWWERTWLHIHDHYLRRLMVNIVDYTKPDVVIVLGDHFRHPNLPKVEFQRRADRFRRIVAGVPVILNITGDRDVGFGHMAHPSYVDQYTSAFGAVNHYTDVGGHRFVALAGHFLDGARDVSMTDEAWAFVDSLVEIQKRDPKPIILLTHVPLFREDIESGCVEKYSVRNVDVPAHSPVSASKGSTTTTHSRDIVRGNLVHVPKEQSHLSPETSQRLMAMLQPVFTFSGHDKYGCYHTHAENSTEISIRAMTDEFSGALGLFEIRKLGPRLSTLQSTTATATDPSDDSATHSDSDSTDNDGGDDTDGSADSNSSHSSSSSSERRGGGLRRSRRKPGLNVHHDAHNKAKIGSASRPHLRHRLRRDMHTLLLTYESSDYVYYFQGASHVSALFIIEYNIFLTAAVVFIVCTMMWKRRFGSKRKTF